MSTPTATTRNIEEERTLVFHLRDTQNDRVHRLLQILRSEAEIKAAKKLIGGEAEILLNQVQELLDQDGVFPRQGQEEYALYQKARRLIAHLSRATHPPASLFLAKGASAYRELSYGGFADTYCCEHHDGLPESTGPVVLKRLRQVSNKDLCREALAWHRLHHAYVLPFLGIDDKTFPSYSCLVSPFLRNKTIMEYLKDKGRQNVSILTLVLEIAKGLQYIHSESIIHGDLHPRNILIDDEGHVKLIDFGLTHLVGATTTLTGLAAVSGIPTYLAPELYVLTDASELQKKTFATDVFAFATVCYEMYNGSGPLAGKEAGEFILSAHEGTHPWLLLPQFTPGEDAAKMPDSLWGLVRRGWGASSGRPHVSEFISLEGSDMGR